jgi:signal transduction histidine kinase
MADLTGTAPMLLAGNMPRSGSPPGPAPATAHPAAGLVHPGRPSFASTLLAVSAFGLSAVTAASLLAAAGATGDSLERGALHLVVIAAPVATGLFAVRSHHSERFGRMLIVAGLIWSLAVLGESSNSVLYSAGRLFAWAIFPLLVYLMLTFPEGRLVSARDRVLVRGVAALIAVLYVGSALLVETYPTPTPWTSCTTACPPNAFLVLDAEPAFVDALLTPLRDGVSVLLLVGVTISLAARMRAATPVRKVTIAPVLTVSIVVILVLVGFIVARRAAPDSEVVRAIGLAWALCLPAISAAFCVGLLRRRLLLGNVLSGLSLALDPSMTPRQLGTALRSSIGDPRLEVLVRDGRGWRREDGEPVGERAIGGPGLIVREIEDAEGPVAAVVLDADIGAEEDELVEVTLSLADATLREGTLKVELEESLVDLDDSRKRIATAADAERRRIERDLHDGAQQRLIALRMRLSLAEDLARDDPASVSAALHSLGDDIDDALEEIRSLAHGIYPALLADRGLPDALASAARACPLRVEVHATGITRHAPEIESAVYMTCIEGLQNVVKHARGATSARLSLTENGTLDFELADDGAGFDTGAPSTGTGIRNMHDRVESLGGTLIVQSAPGHGAVVRGTVPLPPHASAGGGTRAGELEGRRQPRGDAVGQHPEDAVG